MENCYVLTFRIDDEISPNKLIKDFSSHFGYRNIQHIGNINHDDFFLTKFQENTFRITIESNLNFGYVMRILTDFKTHPQTIHHGFILLIRDMLMHSLKVTYDNIEFFEEANFNIINKRFNDRLISRKSMCEFLENKSIESLPVEISIKEIGNIKLTKGKLLVLNNTSFEQAWYSFSQKLEYDGWDMSTAEFLPLTLEEYQNEINQFTNYWQELNKNEFELLQKESLISIIRTSKDWNYNEYIIKYKNCYQYVGVDIYTG
ncbi:hypothetical protein A5M85_05225 [Cellulophaga lytica]|uniref:hypothetical protein n=1 Tax=Cellulophaga lytica TaxID=979 RepID=UPI0009504771|nr:hypothetical protein [Cellulophaga lytica]APU09704.1 hypothetical protein A5M85_05225 [Cellulophaga lytica]